MATVLNKTTLELLESANTPDYPSADWLVNPDLSAVTGLDRKYWKVVNDSVVAMTAQEQADKDAADEQARLAAERSQAIASLSATDSLSIRLRAITLVTQRELHAIKDGTPRPKKGLPDLASEVAQIIQNGEAG